MYLLKKLAHFDKKKGNQNNHIQRLYFECIAIIALSEIRLRYLSTINLVLQRALFMCDNPLWTNNDVRGVKNGLFYSGLYLHDPVNMFWYFFEAKE